MPNRRLPGDLGPNEITELLERKRRSGARILDLTESNPKRVGLGGAGPVELQALAEAGGATYEPHPRGTPGAREAVARYYERRLGLKYPVESVLITGGARPLLYGSYRTVLDPGDVAVYPVPSWNNNHYAYLCGARAIEIPVRAESNFFPTVDDLRPHLPYARLILLNSPLNPTGTAIDPEVLRTICEAIVAENRHRARTGAKAAWLCYDQVYWQLVFGGARHVTPPEVC